jgi:hypothetical protein
MECPNCHFQNMPGNSACMQCGASLTLTSAAIAIHPPRASTTSKWLRSWFPALRYYHWLRYRIDELDIFRLPAWVSAACVVAQLNPGTWPRMVIPGWGHAHQGQFARGRWFLIGWLATALLCAFTFGSGISAVFAGLVLAVHGGAIVDLAWQSRDLKDQRTAIASVLVTTLAAGVMVAALYIPLQWAVSSVIDARQWLRDAPPLATDDVVLFRPQASLGSLPQPGEVVVYIREGYSIPQGYHRVLQRLTGDVGMDRIIAGSASVVRWRSGELTVNGETTEWRPINMTHMPGDFELHVPLGSVCIFPSTDAPLSRSGSLEQWLQQSLVRHEAILGRAVVRNYPFWRFWRIR